MAPSDRSQHRFDLLLQEELQDRVLPFDYNAAVHDYNAAVHAAELAAQRKERGRPVDMRDTFIVGIALAKRAALVTRNLRQFDDLAVTVIDPWAGKMKNNGISRRAVIDRAPAFADAGSGVRQITQLKKGHH